MPTYVWRCPICKDPIVLRMTIEEYEATDGQCACTRGHSPKLCKRVYDVNVVVPEGFH